MIKCFYGIVVVECNNDYFKKEFSPGTFVGTQPGQYATTMCAVSEVGPKVTLPLYNDRAEAERVMRDNGIHGITFEIVILSVEGIHD